MRSPSSHAHGLSRALRARVCDLLGTGRWASRVLWRDPWTQSVRLRRAGHSDHLLRLTRDRASFERERAAARVLVGSGLCMDPVPGSAQDEGDPHMLLWRARGALRAVRQPKPADLGAVIARLHDRPTLGLMRSFSWHETPGVLAVFQELVEGQRRYLAWRTQDGLPQDMLALQLADLGRVVRRYVLAQQHYFMPHPRRTLCHGDLGPRGLVRDERGLRLVALSRVCLGDAARDLAIASLGFGLRPEQETELIEHYLDRRQKKEAGFVRRFFAHRQLALLERPVRRLLGLYGIKQRRELLLDPPVPLLREQQELATQELAVALTSLNDFLGRGRPLAARDVASMGRLISHEELLLASTPCRVWIRGASYTGKTPVATRLARRLGARYGNLAALIRAGLQRCEAAPQDVSLDALLAQLEGRDVRLGLIDEAPGYELTIDAEPCLPPLDDLPLRYAQRRWLAHPRLRAFFKSWLQHPGTTSWVVDGEGLDVSLSRDFFCCLLRCDVALRQQRRQAWARAQDPVPPPLEAQDEPPAAQEQADLVVDVERQTNAQITLQILQQLLPPVLRAQIPVDDFTGRRPLFEP